MSESTEAVGKCLCGGVEIRVKQLSRQLGACHCSMCRQWAGGPFFALDGQQAVTILGEENISRYDSSEWAERAFCSQCGTHLFYHLKATDQHMLSAGLFDLDDELEFDHQIFIDEKPGYYCFADKTKNMTGAEVFAAFSGA
jgi:hypothetical protein